MGMMNGFNVQVSSLVLATLAPDAAADRPCVYVERFGVRVSLCDEHDAWLRNAGIDYRLSVDNWYNFYLHFPDHEHLRLWEITWQ